MRTLDYLAAKTAYEMVEAAKQHNAPKDIENVITKALGVLQAQGVYALYLYLYSQAKNEHHPATFMVFYLWNELRADGAVPLPPKAQVKHPLQTVNTWSEIEKTKNKQKKQSLEQDCRKILQANETFWGDVSKMQLRDITAARTKILEHIRDLTTDLDTLLLVRDLYEQTLIYARYHAKALGG